MRNRKRSSWWVEPLRRDHERERFDCGEPPLDEYLSRYARQNHESGVARTFVAVEESEPRRVMGYYSLAAGAIDRANLPPQDSRRFPNFPVPIVRLARLAVDRESQGVGLGQDLLIDALNRCLRVADEVGIAAVMIDAKHLKAKTFYSRFELTALPDQPLTLWLSLARLRRLFSTE